MKALTPVLLTGNVGDHPLRLFRSPLHGPDAVWHSVDDLHLALRFSRDLRRTFKAKLQQDWAANVRTVATPSGVTTIAPHPMAQGLIDSAVDFGCAPPGAYDQYVRAAAQAFGLIVANMPPTEAVAFSIAAYQRGGGM